jgi:hypothetical protein
VDADRIVERWRASLDATGKPRGVRNNNPGNIRPSLAYVWRGQIAIDSGGYVIFDTAEHGIRAVAVDLLTKYKRGLVTVKSIITVYAPPEENDTEAYIAAVCADLGVVEYAWLHLTEPDTLRRFVKAIIKHECGPGAWYTDAQLDAGIAEARP